MQYFNITVIAMLMSESEMFYLFHSFNGMVLPVTHKDAAEEVSRNCINSYFFMIPNIIKPSGICLNKGHSCANQNDSQICKRLVLRFNTADRITIFKTADFLNVTMQAQP